MSSPQLHDQISARQHGLATWPVDEQHERSAATNQPRLGFGSRARRSAIAVAIAAGIATGTAASLTSGGQTPGGSAQSSGATAMQVPHVGATSASFVRRVRTLEAAGYLDYACAVHGELMFNPRLHRYVTVPA
jgi:hypothetical protein